MQNKLKVVKLDVWVYLVLCLGGLARGNELWQITENYFTIHLTTTKQLGTIQKKGVYYELCCMWSSDTERKLVA
mgnify:CR=1 FL=1